jgi:hypothetical protein
MDSCIPKKEEGVMSGKCDQSVINRGLPTMGIHVHLIATIDKLYLKGYEQI